MVALERKVSLYLNKCTIILNQNIFQQCKEYPGTKQLGCKWYSKDKNNVHFELIVSKPHIPKRIDCWNTIQSSNWYTTLLVESALIIVLYRLRPMSSPNMATIHFPWYIRFAQVVSWQVNIFPLGSVWSHMPKLSGIDMSHTLCVGSGATIPTLGIHPPQSQPTL